MTNDRLFKQQRLAIARYGMMKLLCGGWTTEAIARTPWFVLSDWLRERGHIRPADEIAREWGLTDGVPCGRPGYEHIRQWALVDERTDGEGLDFLTNYWIGDTLKAMNSPFDKV